MRLSLSKHRTNRSWRLLFVIGLVAIAASPAGAQSQPAADASGRARGDGQVSFQRGVKLTPQDQVIEGERGMARMEGASAGIRRQLEQARAARDVVKTLCLNDKLSQADVAIRSARDRHGSLKTAAARNDVELSNHEFTILTVLRQRADQLTAEANQCIGEESAFVGDTKTVTTVDPSLPGTDETEFPTTDTTIIGEVPKCTSCLR
jgi:hypothetical protein